MDSTLVLVMMICVAMLLGVLPFGVFLGIGNLLESTQDDVRLLIVYILAALVFSYLSALGAFALIQKQSCGKVNMKQVASNAGIATGFQAAALLIAFFIPSSRKLVTDLLPVETDSLIQNCIGYSYWSAWAGLFGVAVGGTLSGVCP